MCDTGIFIQLFRGDEQIRQNLQTIGSENLALSVITQGEIYFGMPKREAQRTCELLAMFKTYHLDRQTSVKFKELITEHSDRQLALPDALIAATALVNSLELYTLNTQDFIIIEDLKLYNP
ncbi:MAG: type II toxin-antitoxin system VapC family toxin [Microscillaceae bacterium]|nr:type II toxin-antitoxin system VapC family toxin [Microscillaceae bacterium]